jgi:predicted RNA-binding Zn ribbon-like protein
MVTAGSPVRSEPEYRFDFCGGQLAIDFTNTVGSRGGAPEEHLRTFGDLAAWAEARGILPRARATRLRRAAAARPAAARAALGRALELREALYRVIEAAAAARRPAPADLAIVNAQVRATFSRIQLGSRRSGSVSETLEHAPGLELTTEDAGTGSVADPILTPVVRAAVELLTSADIARVRTCADQSCAWLFLDTTRSRTRRWCDMKSCGNRSKVRRFRGGQ